MRRAVQADAVLCLLLALAGVVLGSSYVRITRQHHLVPVMPDFSRQVFGAAAMSICGRGLRTPDVTANAVERSRPEHKALAEFIDQRRETLSCSQIPEDQPAAALDGMQRASRNLIQLVAGTWALTGLTWAAIDYLHGVMFGLSVALTYFIGRLAMGPGAATIVTAVMLLSPIQLSSLWDLRDYAKAPFFLATLLITGLLITRRHPPRSVVVWCATGGALLGFGFGIRTDVAINLVLLVGVVVTCLPGSPRENWRLRGYGAIACLLGFGVVAWPILSSQSSGNNLWHWALLGYAHEWDRALDVVPGPYELMYFYSDSYVATTIDAFAGRTLAAPAHVSVGVPGYAEASRAYYLTLVGTFPSDTLLRAWAAVIQVMDLPFSGMHSLSPEILPEPVTRAINLLGRARVLFAGFGAPVLVVAVLLLSVTSLRLAVALFAVVVFLGAYPAIQFQLRHVFHLELLSVWLLGFLVSAGLARIVDRWRRVPGEDRKGATRRDLIQRPIGFAIAVALLVMVPLVVLRASQRRTATALMNSYVTADREPLPASAEPAGPGTVRLAKDALAKGAPRSMYSDMLMVELSADGCPVSHTSMSFTYDTANPDLDFTRTYDVAVPPAGVARVFVPIYRSGSTVPTVNALNFGGIVMSAAEQPCLKGLSRFAEVDRYPLLIPVVLQPDWRPESLRQTIRGWEGDSSRRRHEPALVIGSGVPNTLVHESLARGNAPFVGLDAPLVYVAGIARVSNERMDVDGVADAPGSYLAAWEASPLGESDLVWLEGELVRGGLAIGLTDSAGWATRITIDTPGPFRAVIKAPRAGRYQLVIANHLSSTSLRNRLAISRFAILPGERR